MRTINAIFSPLVFLGFCLCLWGCAWNHYTEGSVFDASDINQIVNGKTTTTDLMNILGTPYAKTPAADGGEQWLYYCSNNSDVIGGVPSLMIEKSQKKRKNLAVLVNKEGVVADYTLSDGPVVTTTTEFTTPSIDFAPVPITLGTQTSTNSKAADDNPKH